MTFTRSGSFRRLVQRRGARHANDRFSRRPEQSRRPHDGEDRARSPQAACDMERALCSI